MNFRKILLPSLLAVILVLVVTTGCTNSKLDVKEIEENKIEENKSTVVIDQNNREVVLDKKPERTVMSVLPLTSIYALLGEPGENLIGMHPGAKSALENSIMAKMYPAFLNASTSFVQGTELNIEEMLSLNPDLVFYWGEYNNQTAQLEKTGIPAIAVKTQGNGDALYTLETWLKILGSVYQKENTINDILKYGQKIKEEIESKVGNIANEKRPRSLVLFRHSDKEINVPGNGHYGRYWIEGTGGYDVAKEIEGTANVNMEQIYKWNPEIIFITNFTATTPDDLYENRIPGQDWSSIDAVKNRRVYKIPLGVYRWYPPSGDGPLMLKWIAQKQHPDIFNYDMAQEIKDYYSKFYNYTLTDEEVHNILVPFKEASEGTGGFTQRK